MTTTATVSSNKEKLKHALADQRELFTDLKGISHPYTDEHVRALARKSMRIGAGLTGEARTKYETVHALGMRAAAAVQQRNAVDVVDTDTKMVGVAGVEAVTLRWEERIESLEYACSCYGLGTKRVSDTEVEVNACAFDEVPETVAAVAARCSSTVRLDLEPSTRRRVQKAVAGTFLESLFAKATVKVTASELGLVLDLCEEAGLKRTRTEIITKALGK